MWSTRNCWQSLHWWKHNNAHDSLGFVASHIQLVCILVNNRSGEAWWGGSGNAAWSTTLWLCGLMIESLARAFLFLAVKSVSHSEQFTKQDCNLGPLSFQLAGKVAGAQRCCCREEKTGQTFKVFQSRQQGQSQGEACLRRAPWGGRRCTPEEQPTQFLPFSSSKSSVS